MNSQKVSRGIEPNICHKHSKSRTGEVYSHAPTIKCHEEVMSKLSSCINDDCSVNAKSWMEQSCHHKKPHMNKTEKIRTVTSNIGPHQSVSSPSTRVTGNRHKNTNPKTLRSKSIPIVKAPNLEDSIDFIPVKLTSANDRKQRPQKRIRNHFDSRKEKTSKLNRPTWDEILRNNLEVVKSNKISPTKSLKCNNYTSKPTGNSKNSSSRQCTPKKSLSLEKIDKVSGQDGHEKTSELPQSTESPISNGVPLFQQINNSADPIKTLDFLIKQLRDGLLKRPQNDSLQHVILDMENALLKISVDNKSHSSHPLHRDMVEKEDPVAGAFQSAASSDTSHKGRTNQLDIVQLEQNLEKSCRYLQSLCIKQKKNCSNHLREKEQLSLQLAESRRLLAVSKSKEKNYEVTIGELRLKLQEANTKIDQFKQSIQEVENKNAILKEENQAMRSLKESMKRIGVRLRQAASENEKLQSKLSLKDLEIEKLKVLLQIKTSPNNNLQQENDLKLSANDLDLKLSDEEKDMSMISVSPVTSWSERPGLICSSQASSSPRHSPSPYNSWQHISSIVQQPSAAADINRGIAVILQDLRLKSERLEPLRLELQNPSSCSSLLSDREAVGSKVVYSDGESEGFSS